jgi:hypothetical protein
MLVVKKRSLNYLSGGGESARSHHRGNVWGVSLCDVLRVDADRYLLSLFVTGDDLGQPRETATELPVRGINEFCCQLMGAYAISLGTCVA